MKLETYLRHRRAFEIGFWVAVAVVDTVANSVVGHLDAVRNGLHFAVWEQPVWEISSALVWFALIPAILAFDARFPLARPQLRRNLCAHALFTVPYSLVHVAGMVGLRHLAYRWMGQHYDFGDWPLQWFYEYLKDARSYVLIVAGIYLYRLVLRRWQGEASLLDAPDEGVPGDEAIEHPQRMLVRKLGKEFLINVGDVEHLEASGNYVNLHVGGRIYPLRETMAGIAARLDAKRFVRVHRSHIVNLDCIGEIEPLDTGDARIRMKSGSEVPFARRHRAQLRDRLG